MAYAVVGSLRRTIVGLLNDDSCRHICVVENPSRHMLGLVYMELRSLQEALDKLNSRCSISKSSSWSRSINMEKVNTLDGQIRETVSELEDILDFNVSEQFYSQIQAGENDMIHPLLFTLDFDELNQQFDSFKQMLQNMKAEYICEIGQEEEHPQEEEEEEEEEEEYEDLEEEEHLENEEEYEDLEEEEHLEEDREEEEEERGLEEAEQVMDVIPSITDHHFSGDGDDDESDSDDMVGLSHTYNLLKNEIMEYNEVPGSEWKTLSFSGMAGIGKTVLAKKLFRDPEIASLFEIRAFVTIGQNYRLEAVLLDILTQVNPGTPLVESDVQRKSTSFLKRMVYHSLKNRSCFIVLDDLWHKTIWYELKSVFPDTLNNDCQVLMTSRLRKVAYLLSPSATYRMPFLNEKDSWHLLRKKVFGDEESSCPPQLVKAGKKIAEYCDGLPLTILKVANILSEAADITPEYWNEVADRQRQHPVFISAYDQMFEVLYRSYDYLPQYLKPFLLYIGVFPQNHAIPCYDLINLWCSEELYGTDSSSVMNYLIKLYTRNLVLFLDKSYYNVTKKIGLHSVFWYMCNKEARKNKFFYCLNTCADTLAEDMESQRRLCIRNNVLFGIKDVRDSISSISAVRSLLCTGAYHQYPVPICLGLRLLKVLYAVTIRFYEFPMEVLDQVNLKYFSLTLDAQLPSSISKLSNLKFLIVRQHVRIVKSPSYLPIEIWNMKELEHLQIMGSNLPNPCEGSDDDDPCILPKLFTLLDVSAQSCTKDIFKRIPHLYKLRVQIELAPDDEVPLCFFDDIYHLHELGTLKCIMATPKIMSGIVVPPAPLSIFSSSLSKLTLSGMGYPWEEMRNISSLPNLVLLKLRCYAFQGPKWIVVDKEFPKLKLLLIEDTDLVEWTSLHDYYSLQNLCGLTLKHCYNLQEIPTTLFGKSLETIELVDCNPMARSCAEQLKEHLDKQYPTGRPVDLKITSSWDDGNI